MSGAGGVRVVTRVRSWPLVLAGWPVGGSTLHTLRPTPQPPHHPATPPTRLL